jgi:hypothetical protein
MRLWAGKAGWTLSDRGLRLATRDAKSSGEVIAHGRILRCDSEEAVFAALGVPYKEPWERNCEPVETACRFGAVPKRPPPASTAVDHAEADDDITLEVEVRGFNYGESSGGEGGVSLRLSARCPSLCALFPCFVFGPWHHRALTIPPKVLCWNLLPATVHRVSFVRL